ncbi:hypothetical protein V6N13_089426 [Hibiscus sabdariffa]|uniref:Uncharacterized protein n=1 Tax=Hibiscus sabdariffa TaxID=183260 RepID=A0ABR2NSQ8_9ROSI
MLTAKGRPSQLDGDGGNRQQNRTKHKAVHTLHRGTAANHERQPAAGTTHDRRRSNRYGWCDDDGLNPDKRTRSHALNNDLCCKRWSGCSRS